MMPFTCIDPASSPWRENAWPISRSETRPRITFSRHHESANVLGAEPVGSFLTLASGAIVATSVPFRFRMLSMVIVSSHRVDWPPISSHPTMGHAMQFAPLCEQTSYHIGGTASEH